MPHVTKRTLLAAAALTTLVAGAARAQGLAGGPFVTRGSGVFSGHKVDYLATVGETFVPGPDGQPGVRFVCTSYVAQGAEAARRPVLFVFNGGPSASSGTLHMLALGPKRLAIAQDPAAASLGEHVVDNNLTVLDVADLVFVDPAETGFSRVLPGSKLPYYYSVNGDAQSVSDFVVAWTKANGREASPKYVAGESYGTLRAAVMAGQLAGVMPLDGVFLFGQAVNMIETSQRAQNAISYATNLTALAAIAAYHGKAPAWKGKSMTAVVDEAYAWGMGEYLQALLQGNDLPAARRKAIAAKLRAMTGIGADYYLAHDLAITKIAFARELLKDRGLILGTYDARYVGPAAKPGARAEDPMSPVMRLVGPAIADHLSGQLGVTWPVSEYRGAAPGAGSWEWNGTLGPGGPFLDYDYQSRLSEAFRANPRFRLMIGTGIYDLTTTVGPARYLVTRSDWPRDRVFQRQYVGGHVAYIHEPSLRAFTDDIRAWVTGGRL
ncbi:hypothetical protein [Phenylobacterium sp.]|uniref:S10 family peptidase n=1 Tax=Phenylobacterium sp. TaxID=1871053 RepID=UPI0025FF3C71|nr:hypothetical protein [Phenylobacterium sp.]